MKSKRFSAFPREGLRFLRSLKRNNNREWFLEHKVIYEASVKQPMISLVEALAEDFQRFAPEMVASPQTSIYRIYRDTRFSNDKTPYKTHVAAIFPRKGLGKHEGAGFYLHISTTELLIGGGLYMPLPEDLQSVRSFIAANFRKFRGIIGAKPFRKMFGDIDGEQLTRVPRGFPADHPAAEFLKYKQFLAGRTLKADEALSPKFYDTVVSTLRAMQPLIRFLNEPLLKANRVRQRQKAVMN